MRFSACAGCSRSCATSLMTGVGGAAETASSCCWAHCATHEYCLFIACGVSRPWKSAQLAGRLRMSAPARGSQYVRRFRPRGETTTSSKPRCQEFTHVPFGSVRLSASGQKSLVAYGVRREDAEFVKSAFAASVPPPEALENGVPASEVLDRFKTILSPWYSVVPVGLRLEQKTAVGAYHLIIRNRKAWGSMPKEAKADVRKADPQGA